MNLTFFIRLAVVVAGLSSALPASAQSDAGNAYHAFAEKQFYRNRIRAGSVLLNGSFGGFTTGDPDIDGLISSLGIGAGVGLSENVVFSFSYRRERDRREFFDPWPGVYLVGGISTVNGVSAGFRFLPNTVGGFVQPYIGLDYVWLREDFRSSPDADPEVRSRLGGANVPVGVILWVSTFMSVSLELINLNLLGNLEPESDYNAVFNAELSMLNPRFGISFLLNGKKP